MELLIAWLVAVYLCKMGDKFVSFASTYAFQHTCVVFVLTLVLDFVTKWFKIMSLNM